LVSTLLVAQTSWTRSFPDSYDPLIKESAYRYLNPWIENDWLLWKAQLYQESLLNPNAVSHAGAIGLAQVMPATYVEQAGIMGINAHPTNPRANVLVGAAYLRRMLIGWSSPRPNPERLRWAWGAYNCGFGCMLKAQKRANGTLQWSVVRRHVPAETRIYVDRIEYWRSLMPRR
jgi:soluble lytic murein transglycosylase-like protein